MVGRVEGHFGMLTLWDALTLDTTQKGMKNVVQGGRGGKGGGLWVAEIGGDGGETDQFVPVFSVMTSFVKTVEIKLFRGNLQDARKLSRKVSNAVRRRF